MQTIARISLALLSTAFVQFSLASCPNVLKTQSAIDSFAVDYPDCVGGEYYSLDISGNDDLITNLDGLAQLTNLNRFRIYNTSVVSLAGLQNVVTIDRFSLEGDRALRDFSGLTSLQKIGRLAVSGSIIETLEGLQALTTIRGISLGNNGALKSLKGLENLTEITAGDYEDLRVNNNSSLEDMSALNNLNFVQGGIEFRGNSLLETFQLTSLEAIGDEEIGSTGFLLIEGSDSLTRIDLPNLARVNSPFTIFRNLPSVEQINVPKLKRVSRLYVVNLTTSDLSFLASVERATQVTIEANANLVSLKGLENLALVVQDLQVSSNSMLSNCTAIDDLLGFPDGLDSGSVGGGVSISNNANGCNSTEEIYQLLNQPELLEDTDDDGVIDFADAFPSDPLESNDQDSDSVGDNSDNCVFQSNSDQADLDGDFVGNECDEDDDGDGVPDYIEEWAGTDPLDALSCNATGCYSVFDIDADGEVTALTDGLLILRFLFGFSGESLTMGATSDSGKRLDADEIEEYLDKRL